jgi:ribonuclease J
MENQNSAGPSREPRRSRSFGSGGRNASQGGGGNRGRRPGGRGGFGGGRGRGNSGPAPIKLNKWASPDEPKDAITHDPDAVRFVPLGGHEEIGRNSSYYEYGNEIVVVDAGIQFPEGNTPGIDYIIPNISSLEPKKANIRGIILTHGHYDHIAAIHYMIEKLGNPVIYASQFTRAMVEKRHEEFINAPKLRFETVTHGTKVKISENFSAEFFAVEHTIPEALGFMLKTPVGNMVSLGDYRLDIGRDGKPQHMEVYDWLATQNVHSLHLDSTRAESHGHGPSEYVVEDNLEMLIRNAQGRVIIATFSSLVDRLMQIMAIADKLGKKVAVQGRSMVTNLDIAKNLGYLKGKTDHFIDIEQVNNYKDHEVIILITGAQGEPNAGLMRVAKGEHRVLRFKPTDSVIFSSSVVPGNEWDVQELQDKVSRQVKEMHTYRTIAIHTGGHAYGGDHELVLSIVKPKFVVPIHGYFMFRKALVGIAEAAGMQGEQVKLMDNGQVCSLTEDAFTITPETVDTSYVAVDGLGVGDVEEMVIRDRLVIGAEGLVAIVIAVDRHTGRLIKSPDVIARGFIHVRDNHALIEEVKRRVKNVMQRVPDSGNADIDFIKSAVREQVNQFIWVKTKRRPMILPIIIEL